MWSNDYIRIPFSDCGRLKTGCDCWGLVRVIYEDMLNIELPSYLEYEDTLDRERIPKLFDETIKSWVQIPIGEEIEYDVAVFRMLGMPMHVGIVIEPPLMIHCERGCGTHVNNYKRDRQWSRSLEGFYRHASRSNLTSPF